MDIFQASYLTTALTLSLYFMSILNPRSPWLHDFLWYDFRHLDEKGGSGWKFLQYRSENTLFINTQFDSCSWEFRCCFELSSFIYEPTTSLWKFLWFFSFYSNILKFYDPVSWGRCTSFTSWNMLRELSIYMAKLGGLFCIVHCEEFFSCGWISGIMMEKGTKGLSIQEVDSSLIFPLSCVPHSFPCLCPVSWVNGLLDSICLDSKPLSSYWRNRVTW